MAKQPVSEGMDREKRRLSVVRLTLLKLPALEHGEVLAPGRVPLSASEQASVAGMAKQVGTMVRRSLENGWFDQARRELASGRNPGRKPWEQVLCQALLEGGTTRAALQLAFQEQLGMTPGSAKVRVSKSIAVFHAGQLIAERGGKILINSN